MLAILYPNVRLNKIHIVINRSSLMSLHKIANGKYCQLFHLYLDLIGDTLFIGRKTRNAKSTSNAYGHNFEAEFTTADPDFEGAEGYFRVIQYKLGDLEVVVRIEADAYMAAKRNPLTFAAPTPAELRESTPGIMHTGPQLTKVVLSGKIIPQDRIIELKSNDKSKPKEQMWFGRTPNSCCGSFQNENRKARDQEKEKAKRGLYIQKNVKMEHMSLDDFEKWETDFAEATDEQSNDMDVQKGLRKLVGLLKLLRETTKNTTEGAAIMVYAEDEYKKRTLTIYEAKEKIGALPEEIVKGYWE
jgi:hypothetical protein